MILIITNNLDWSTNEIIDWLGHFNAKFVRLNMDELHLMECNIYLNEKKTYFEIEIPTFGKINSNEINSVWFRRSADIDLKVIEIFKNEQLRRNVGKYLFTEIKYLREAIYAILKDKFVVNNPFNSKVDKAMALITANKCGLKIPNTILSNSNNSLKKFMIENKTCITKPIHNMERLVINNNTFLQYTSKIKPSNLRNDSNINYYPLKIQKEIEKTYEIRVFYLHKELYSMAIFSQNDKQTETDFRQYNYKNPNRTVPIKLDKKTEKKIVNFMQSMALNCGSLDFIKSKDGFLYFLEVNPVGQFGMVSHPCNYNLEMLIAKKLIENDKKKY